MPRKFMLPGLFVACIAVMNDSAVGQENQAPTYQRRPVERPYTYPRYYPRGSVQAGTFQRPYPYHLDYYRKQYGGGYEPYFGNLYGPPRIVGTQPFAFSPYPGSVGPPPHEQFHNYGPQGYTGPPLATPFIQCPHCQQPVQLQWQTPQASPAAETPAAETTTP